MNAEIKAAIKGFGHAMCDINVEVDAEGWDRLEKFLSWKSVDSPRHVGDKELREVVGFILKIIKNENSISYNAGGSALNALRVASLLDTSAAFYGCIGADAYGDVIREGLRASSIRDMVVLDDEEGGATGIFCTVRRAESRDGSRLSQKRVIASPASARKIRAFDVDSLSLEGTRILHVEGLLADTPHFLNGLVQHCRDAGTSVSADLVSAEFVRKHRVALVQAIALGIDVIFCTKREFEALECDPGSMSERITWIIKADRDGVDCRSKGHWHHVDAPRCGIIDDLGAGDAFAGAFLTASLGGKSIAQCLELASASAACALSVMGPSPERTCIEALRREFLAD